MRDDIVRVLSDVKQNRRDILRDAIYTVLLETFFLHIKIFMHCLSGRRRLPHVLSYFLTLVICWITSYHPIFSLPPPLSLSMAVCSKNIEILETPRRTSVVYGNSTISRFRGITISLFNLILCLRARAIMENLVHYWNLSVDSRTEILLQLLEKIILPEEIHCKTFLH